MDKRHRNESLAGAGTMKPPVEETQCSPSSRPRLSGIPANTQGPSGDLPTLRPPQRARRWFLVAGGLGLAIVVVLVLRGTTARTAPSSPAAAVTMEGSRIRFSEEFAARHHVASVQAAEAELSPTIQVMGTVRYDVRKFAAVGARSAGRVRRVLKIMGDEVKPGDILADLESVDLGKAQATAEALRAKEIAAESNLRREQQLAEAKVTALREAESAKAEHQALRAERRAAEKAVIALGAALDSEVGVLKLRSPIAGRVIMAKASRGQTVEPSDTLFEVADLSTVWVELMVFERDLDRIRKGDAVEILPAAARGESVQGTLAQVGDIVDPTTRSAIVRVDVDNRKGWLRPGQSTSARIQSRAPAARVLTIPKDAVSFIDGKPTALVQVGPGLVEPRPVDLGPDDGERVTIRQGLRAGESVITEGLFALKSEIFR
ncbi:MAG TPA: efflux RND transporter periplasmic adaptor subunit [Polyangia bacterium]